MFLFFFALSSCHLLYSWYVDVLVRGYNTETIYTWSLVGDAKRVGWKNRAPRQALHQILYNCLRSRLLKVASQEEFQPCLCLRARITWLVLAGPYYYMAHSLLTGPYHLCCTAFTWSSGYSLPLTWSQFLDRVGLMDGASQAIASRITIIRHEKWNEGGVLIPPHVDCNTLNKRKAVP